MVKTSYRIRNTLLMPLAMWARAVTGLPLLLAGFPVSAELEVVSLRHRTADQVLPVLRPLVESGGALTGASALRQDVRRVWAEVEAVER